MHSDTGNQTLNTENTLKMINKFSEKTVFMKTSCISTDVLKFL